MRSFIVLSLMLLLALFAITNVQANLNVFTQEENVASAPLPRNGAAVDEVIVESSLYIKPKPVAKARRTRSASNELNVFETDDISLVEHKRVKRITAVEDDDDVKRQSKLLDALKP